MMPAKRWVAIALVAAVVGVPPLARAQAEVPGEPAIESWLAEGPDDPGPGTDDDMDSAAPGMAGGGFEHGGMAASGRWGMMRHGRGGMGGFMRARFADLDLTEAQRTKLADIRDKHAKTAISGRAEVQLAQLELHKLLRADKPDVAAVNRQIDKVSSLQAALTKNRVGGMLEARAVLTPEQLQKLRESRGMGPRRGTGESEHSDH
jgi:Spy/CpxP family protein refolding chaperone